MRVNPILHPDGHLALANRVPQKKSQTFFHRNAVQYEQVFVEYERIGPLQPKLAQPS